MTPLVVDGRAPLVLPAFPLPGRDRDRHPLYVMERTVHLRTLHGWERIPRGYVTDFASIPVLATVLTGLDLQALGKWAWAAIAHDWLYAVGQPGYKAKADDVFRERLQLDGVDGFRTLVLYQSVHRFGGHGYAEAPSWWATENFADPETGAYPVAVPFRREDAFADAPWGLRARPDWREPEGGAGV